MSPSLQKAFFKIKNPIGITLVSYTTVMLVGFFDFYTNPEFSFSLFYLIPIAFNAWYLDRKNGFFISITSAITWLYVDVSSAPPYENFIAPYWNMTIRLGFFVIVVFLLSEIKYLYLNLEGLVKERTDDLSKEIRKKNIAEAELTRSRNLYQDLVENINEVYYTTDAAGNFQYISPNFYKTTGLAESDVKRRTFYDIVYHEDRLRIRNYYNSIFAEKKSDASCEFRIKNSGGNYIWFEQNSKIVNKGKHLEIRSLLRDVSERKAAETALIHSEIKFKKLFMDDKVVISESEYLETLIQTDPTNIMRSLADRIDEITEQISGRVKQALGFSSLASHELRTPLAIIRNQLEENLRADTPLQQLKETTASIYDEVLRLQRIIGELLKLSKMEAGNFKLQKEIVQLNSFISHFYEETKLLAQAKNIEVTLCIGDEIKAEIDPAYFLQMLFNIFDNALKYTPENGKISVGMNRTAEGAEIFIEDNGAGMSAAGIEKIFTPFYQSDSGNLSSGTGLGLILSKWIAELHDGNIFIESQLNEGTKVTITLPVLPT
jgi:PAS domain S-box-containing protein